MQTNRSGRSSTCVYVRNVFVFILSLISITLVYSRDGSAERTIVTTIQVPVSVANVVRVSRHPESTAKTQAPLSPAELAKHWDRAFNYNTQKSKQLILQAADHGDPLARGYAAIMYTEGLCGVQADSMKASQYAVQCLSELKEKARAEQRNIHVQFVLGHLLRIGMAFGSVDIGWNALVMEQLKRHSRAGDPNCQASLSWLHTLGVQEAWCEDMELPSWKKSVLRLRPQSIEYLHVNDNDHRETEITKQMAQKGDGKAQCALAHCYLDGKCVKESTRKALKWFRRAAKKGIVDAECNIGYFYYDNTKKMYNLKKAIHWFRLASAHGDGNASYVLSYMYQEGMGVPQSAAQARDLEELATRQNAILRPSGSRYVYPKEYLGLAPIESAMYRSGPPDPIRLDIIQAVEENDCDPTELGILYAEFGEEGGDEKAIELLLPEARKGNARAQCALFIMYANHRFPYHLLFEFIPMIDATETSSDQFHQEKSLCMRRSIEGGNKRLLDFLTQVIAADEVREPQKALEFFERAKVGGLQVAAFDMEDCDEPPMILHRHPGKNLHTHKISIANSLERIASTLTEDRREGDWVVFDVDYVLITPEDIFGRPKGQLVCQNLLTCGQYTQEEINRIVEIMMCRIPYRILDTRILDIIQNLQQSGACVLALTGMRVDFQEDALNWRVKQLKEFGMGFEKSDMLLQRYNWDNSGGYQEGVIRAGRNRKGDALMHLVSLVSCAEKKPKRILFIDNSRRYIQSVFQSCRKANIEFQGIHYVHSFFDDDIDPDEGVIQYQLDKLVETSELLPYEECCGLSRVHARAR